MKNITLFICLIFSSTAFTQEFYLKFGGGYAFPGAGKQIYSYAQRDILNTGIEPYLADLVFDQQTNLVSSKKVKDSYGRGGKVGVTFGYMFGEHTGFEVAFNGFFGTKIKSEVTTDNGNISHHDFSTSALMYTITPAFVVSTPMADGSVKPYGRLGAYIGIDPRITTRAVANIFGNKDAFKFGDRLSGKTIFGVEIAFGSDFRLSSKLSAYAELTLISASASFKKRNIIQDEIFGINILPVLDVTEFDLVKRLPDFKNAGPALDESHPMPFGSIGLNVGVKYSVR